MTRSWHLQDGPEILRGAEAVEILAERISAGHLETWFECSDGALLAVVTNRQRAMVLMLDEPGDPGQHAVDPLASLDCSEGYVLANGQWDSYADRDTVVLDHALTIVARVIDGEHVPTDTWQIDR